MMRKELRIFFTAMMFFTRLPCPKVNEYHDEDLNKASKYFTLIGLIVGGIVAFSLYVFSFLFPENLALLLCMITSVLLTGAFHEDGFADACDGFGGGWSKIKILDIMKDSRLGTYGTIGIIGILSVKFLALQSLLDQQIALIIIAGNSISRLISVSLIFTDEYAKDDLLSKAKPLAVKMNIYQFLLALLFGIIPFFLFHNYFVFVSLIPLVCIKYFASKYFNKWIGGYTGDCLGAVQQVAEVVFYLSLIVLFKYFI